MYPRVFVTIDPRLLRLRLADAAGADPGKLHDQTLQFGSSMKGMPPPECYRGSDGEILLYNGIIRATRIARESPGTPIVVEILEEKKKPYGSFPLLGDTIP